MHKLRRFNGVARCRTLGIDHLVNAPRQLLTQKWTVSYGFTFFLDRRMLNAMGALTPEQRCYLGLKFKEVYDKDLRAFVKSECGTS